MPPILLRTPVLLRLVGLLPLRATTQSLYAALDADANEIADGWHLRIAEAGGRAKGSEPLSNSGESTL